MTDTTTTGEAEGARKDFDHAIKDEDIERARLVIGHDTAQGTREYYSEATRDGIRNFALSYGGDNPLYTDFDYGRRTRWGAQSRHK